MAARAGLRAIAVADHNRTSAVGPALAAAEGRGVRVVPAVELDCIFDQTPLHLLGYHIRHNDPRYHDLWEQLREKEAAASILRMDLVRRLGLEFSPSEALSLGRDGIVTGELIAELVLANPANHRNLLLTPYIPGGGRDDNPFVNFYWDFCAKGKPAHVDIGYMDFSEAVALIEETGGVPVLAHPGIVLRDRENIAPRLAMAGLRGVEAFSSYHSPDQCLRWLRFGMEHDLFITCGSDFHGKTKPSVRLGEHGGKAYEDVCSPILA